VLAVISSKVTLRERIAQTGYWKKKLAQDPTTKDIRVFFITPDEDGTLKARSPMKKGRAIVETNTDGAYVMSEEPVEPNSDLHNEVSELFQECGNLVQAEDGAVLADIFFADVAPGAFTQPALHLGLQGGHNLLGSKT